jgi:hypothetical protein
VPPERVLRPGGSGEQFPPPTFRFAPPGVWGSLPSLERAELPQVLVVRTRGTLPQNRAWAVAGERVRSLMMADRGYSPHGRAASRDPPVPNPAREWVELS